VFCYIDNVYFAMQPIIEPLRLVVPTNYPISSPVIVDKKLSEVRLVIMKILFCLYSQAIIHLKLSSYEVIVCKIMTMKLFDCQRILDPMNKVSYFINKNKTIVESFFSFFHQKFKSPLLPFYSTSTALKARKTYQQ